VFILREASLLRQQASNAMLKLLEEPPESTLFVLLTSDVESLLPTILSRCQRVDLSPLSRSSIARELEDIHGMSSQEATELARLSCGRIGWALEAAKSPQLLADYKVDLERVALLLESGLEERFAYAEETAALFARSREEATARLNVALAWWRDLLLLKEDSPELVSNTPAMDALQRHANWVSAPQVVAAIRRTQDTMSCLESNVNPRLALDVLMLSLPQREATPSVASGPRRAM
jgi:DNA polymerase-3 subunit delta'